MDRNKCRRRNASENLSVNDSGRRRPWVELNVSSVVELRQDFGNRSRSLMLAVLQVKHVAKEKEYRVLTVNRRSSNSSASSNKSNGGSSSNNNKSNEAARLVQLSAGKDKGRGSRKVARREHQEKRHRLDRDKYIVNKTPAAPERPVPEPLFIKPEL